MSTKSSPFFEGRFGRMFRSLHPATFGRDESENEANLAALAKAMSAEFDGPKDGKDDEESGIPALYTYLGQFIDTISLSTRPAACRSRMIQTP
jgi:hypothetical protein